ncbi:MAG: ATP-binding protein [Synergistaceae bacterium]|nr:ATP-binding protein [Synergistaceae bacterium]
MKVTVKNLGVLKHAEFEVGGLTIICGANNTGKTYATYALYGFMAFWNQNFMPDLLEKDTIEKLIVNGNIRIDLENIKKKSNEVITEACKEFLPNLPMVFAAPDKYFESACFSISLDSAKIKVIEEYDKFASPGDKRVLNVVKKHGENFLDVNILTEIEKEKRVWLKHIVNSHLLDVVFGNTFTIPFIASAERTGAAIFHKELDFSRNRLLEHMSNNKNDRDPLTLLNRFFDKGYALPVNRDVDFIRDFEGVSKEESIIARDNPGIMESFGDILGGEYKVTKEALYFVPSNKNVKLKIGESASSVRSLLDIGLYIRHKAKPGDILMIDEPELNLHPANQRRMARLLAKLVNAGVKVFITTHSDYILKEFNTLIMLRRGGAATTRVIEEYGYDKKELLDAVNVRAYIAQEAHLKTEDDKRARKRHTFVQAPIGEYGIDIESFDETINTMNDIQRELVFGD